MHFRTHTTWLVSLIVIGFMSTRAYGASENPDVQSPEEIARAHAIIERDFKNAIDTSLHPELVPANIMDMYAYLDPAKEVPADLLQQAVAYFNANKASFPNQQYITIVDFRPRSDHYRLFIVNMSTGTVEKYHTTHGVNSDPDQDGVATVFGNVIDSGKSSLGPVRTAEVYTGAYKRSVRLDGLASTNSNIRDRAIVFHGWDGVHEENVIQGMSHGCITLDWKVKDAAIDKVKEGSLLYIGQSAKP